MKFSQRIGKTEVRTVIQRDTMDDLLKNRLFNIVRDILESAFTYEYGQTYMESEFLKDYCDEFGIKTTDLRNEYRHFIEHLNLKIYINDDIWFFMTLLSGYY